MTQQSKHQEKFSMRELLARFSIGAIMGGAIALCYWLYIICFTLGWTKTATIFSIAWILLFTKERAKAPVFQTWGCRRLVAKATVKSLYGFSHREFNFRIDFR
ncbi:hypothetical protein NIES4075_27520 [Tolypothrix sp. NIES-4075]|uniref:hypothetical protein n=1 Tax=Tolypothrix sp. NIES-4075 TaxID=2005459 RepID=UPI000B5CD0A2|nr:hypothetical protein [Tolypothrix sp. NIES-4075]GAX41755.1 hypothetical protein NIES4075_27520 [Tolypothrix sp. NIES-4075]